MLGEAYVDLAADVSDTVARSRCRNNLFLHLLFGALILASFFAAVGWRAVAGHWDGNELQFYGFLAGISRVFQMFGVEIVVNVLRYMLFYNYAAKHSTGWNSVPS